MQSNWGEKSLGPQILAYLQKQTDLDKPKLPLGQAGGYFSLPFSGLSCGILAGIPERLPGGEGKFTASSIVPGGCAQRGVPRLWDTMDKVRGGRAGGKGRPLIGWDQTKPANKQVLTVYQALCLGYKEH